MQISTQKVKSYFNPESGQTSVNQASAGKAENLISQEVQLAISPLFWSTILFPLTSYLWTLAWMAQKSVFGRVIKPAVDRATRRAPASLKINVKNIKPLSKVQRATIIIFDLLWFLAAALAIALFMAVVCGKTPFLGRISAFAVRTAAKVGSGGSANFDFCDQIPNLNP